MADNELTGTQAQPEGETVANPVIQSMEPENVNTDVDQDDGQSIEGNQDNSTAEVGQSGQGYGTSEQEEQKPKKMKFSDLPKWATARVNEETNRRRAAEERNRELEAELTRFRGGTVEAPVETPAAPATAAPALTQADIDRRAAEMLADREYQSRIDEWAKAGNADYKDDFTERCNLIAGLGAGQDFMKIVTDPEIVGKAGHKVVAELADDPEEAQRILRLPPVKMALELAKFSEKISAPPAPKQVSKVPPPVAPVTGAPKVGTRLDDPDTPMDKFADELLKTLNRKR